MMVKKDLKIFEQKEIRTHWDEQNEKWYFSITDICEVLAETNNGKNYWKVLKNRLKKEGSQLVTNCNQLKMMSADGKYYKTDVADTKQILRLIQSIPSKKAEPFKMWLAQVGSQRLDEIADPELTIDRAIETYKKKGYSDKWINQRIKTIEVRKELTDEWQRSGVDKGKDYAILTNEITKAWSGLTVTQYKKHKSLKNENLRDNMTNIELILNMLAEAATTEISKTQNPQGLQQSKVVAQKGGKIAKNTRKDIEQQTKKPVVSKLNAKDIDLIAQKNGDENEKY